MKKVTRAISMLLVCVMALCLFTACGDGSYPNADIELLYKAGCSYSIKQDKTLQDAAEAFAAYAKDRTDTDKKAAAGEALAAVAEKYESGYIGMVAAGQAKYIKLTKGMSVSDLTATIPAAEAASFNYYGAAHVTVSGVDMTILLVG